MAIFFYINFNLCFSISFSKETFVYNSSLWTNKESHKPLEGKVFNNLNETKLPTYWSTPLSEICLVKIGGVVYPTMVISDYQAPSLLSSDCGWEKTTDQCNRHFRLAGLGISVRYQHTTGLCRARFQHRR